MKLFTMSVGRLKYSCKFPGCSNAYYTKIKDPKNYRNKRFHTFPTNEEFRNKWREACSIRASTLISVKSSFYVCADHFELADYKNSELKTLNWNAVPKLIASTKNVKSEPTLDSTSESFENESTSEDGSSLANDFFSENVNLSLNGVKRKITFSPTDDHDYCKNTVKLTDVNVNNNESQRDEYSFLLDTFNSEKVSPGNRKILTALNTPHKMLSPKQKLMYKVHRLAVQKLGKLSTKLEENKDEIKELKRLYAEGYLNAIEEDLNPLTRNFIKSQSLNAKEPPSDKKWTIEDKVFALSVYKRSPRLYKYLRSYFELPSKRTLQVALSTIPLEPGVNAAMIDLLKMQVSRMNDTDKICSLMFDEISLQKSLYYMKYKNKIVGYDDLGHLGSSKKCADRGLIFMLRGLARKWKQIVGYYFTCSTISPDNLKEIILELLKQLESIGLKVVATVCDEGSTKMSALNKLSKETIEKSSNETESQESSKDICKESSKETVDDEDSHYFIFNHRKIYIVVDVPYLLKCTRNSLINNKLIFDEEIFFNEQNNEHITVQKEAKIEYLKQAFDLSELQKYKLLYKLKESHFTKIVDSSVNMKVDIAARQLSNTMAVAIETYATFGKIPADALQTAEFVHMIDNLFDSLNSASLSATDGKMYQGALTKKSLHIQFWDDLLDKMKKWKLINLETGNDVTNTYSFIKGWQTTIKSVKALWEDLQVNYNLSYLCLRSLNQDPLGNLFCQIKQYGIMNTYPTCYQFATALKISLINNLKLPTKQSSNCENDDCELLENLRSFIISLKDRDNDDSDNNDDSEEEGLEVCYHTIPDNHNDGEVNNYENDSYNLCNHNGVTGPVFIFF